MAETNNTPNLAEVQKIHDALAGKSLESKEGKNPLAQLNPDSFSAEYTFKTEYERQMYLASLSKNAIKAAIVWLNTPDGSRVQDAQQMKNMLERKLGDFEKIQKEVRTKLSSDSLILSAAISGLKWEKSDNVVTVEGKKYGVEKREGSEKGKSDLKIDAGFATSVLIKDVPDKEIAKVLLAYQNANKKNAPDSPLKSGLLGKTVKYEEIKTTLVQPDVPVKNPEMQTESVKITGLPDGYASTNKLEQTTIDRKNGYKLDIIGPNNVKIIVLFDDNKKPVENSQKILFGNKIYTVRQDNGTVNFSENPVNRADNKPDINTVLKDVTAPKGYDISYDGEKKQVQLKKGNKIVGYFTPENEENKNRRTAPQIQKWAETKVQKIRDAVDAENPDKHPYASKVLESIQKITGPDGVGTLSELGFKRNEVKLILPEGLSWKDDRDSSNWDVQLEDGYTVYKGKVVKVGGRSDR